MVLGESCLFLTAPKRQGCQGCFCPTSEDWVVVEVGLAFSSLGSWGCSGHFIQVLERDIKISLCSAAAWLIGQMALVPWGLFSPSQALLRKAGFIYLMESF